ncbi:MAG: SCO family protein [Acidobacteriota bacterium]
MSLRRATRLLVALVGLGASCVWADSLYRQPGYVPSQLPPGQLPPQLKNVGITEKLGEQIDLDLTFVAEDGYPHKLREYFYKDRPVILNLVYYECPQLCTLILNAQVQTMREIPWTPGNQYEIVTISIDPREAFDKARAKKSMYLSTYDRPAPGWHFLTDYQGNVQKLAMQAGFNYKYDERIEQYAHPAAIMVLTPQGKMARYLYGITYSARDLRFALAEASENRITMAIEKVLLLCYMYDPNANKYVLFATNFMKAGGVLVMALFGWFWWRMIRADRIRTARLASEQLERMT